MSSIEKSSENDILFGVVICIFVAVPAIIFDNYRLAIIVILSTAAGFTVGYISGRLKRRANRNT